MPDTERFGTAAFDAKEPGTSFPPIEPLRPPKGAPNVLIVLLDDVGFVAASAFGGPVSTPTAERLAKGGLKYTRFHTTALCLPTRQCLLTGRNHLLGLQHFYAEATAPIPAGKHLVRMEFAYDGGGLGKGPGRRSSLTERPSERARSE